MNQWREEWLDADASKEADERAVELVAMEAARTGRSFEDIANLDTDDPANDPNAFLPRPIFLTETEFIARPSELSRGSGTGFCWAFSRASFPLGARITKESKKADGTLGCWFRCEPSSGGSDIQLRGKRGAHRCLLNTCEYLHRRHPDKPEPVNPPNSRH
ncbi:unnamed protein product [Symbiodinium natans]|uniref:Uncharacterized protein n=1 Tax=Symbiodinium natans TaxID=878477 RepID=A0A812S063_9DINO|nr:unnamed protein product [Symbiodinium natans]